MPILVWVVIGLWGGLIAAITLVKFVFWLAPWQWPVWGWWWWPWNWPVWGWWWWPWNWPWWKWPWWPWWWPWNWLWWWWIIPLGFLVVVIPLGFFECFELWLILVIAVLLFLLLLLVVFLFVWFGWWQWPWWPWWWWKWPWWPWRWPWARWQWWRWPWWPWWWWQWPWWPWWFWPWWKSFWWFILVPVFWAVIIVFIVCKCEGEDGEGLPPEEEPPVERPVSIPPAATPTAIPGPSTTCPGHPEKDDDGDGFSNGEEWPFLGEIVNILPRWFDTLPPEKQEEGLRRASNPCDPNSTPERDDVPGTCRNGRDDDGDGFTDGADPGCPTGPTPTATPARPVPTPEQPGPTPMATPVRPEPTPTPTPVQPAATPTPPPPTPTPPRGVGYPCGSWTVYYEGPQQVSSGGTLTFTVQVTDADGNPGPPGSIEAAVVRSATDFVQTSGELDANGRATLSLHVPYPPGEYQFGLRLYRRDNCVLFRLRVV